MSPVLHTFYLSREIPATLDQVRVFGDLAGWHYARLITSRQGCLHVTLRRCLGVCCGDRADYRRVLIRPDGEIIDYAHGRASAGWLR